MLSVLILYNLYCWVVVIFFSFIMAYVTFDTTMLLVDSVQHLFCLSASLHRG